MKKIATRAPRQPAQPPGLGRCSAAGRDGGKSDRLAPCPPALFSLGQPHCARGVRAVCRPGSTPARVLPTLTPPLPALLQEFCLCGAPRAHRLAPLAATAGDPLIAAARAAAGVLSLAPLGRSDWPPLQRQRASPRCPCPLIRRLLHASIADRYLFAFAISSCGGLLALVLHVVLGRCLGGEVRGGASCIAQVGLCQRDERQADAPFAARRPGTTAPCRPMFANVRRIPRANVFFCICCQYSIYMYIT